MNIKMSMKVLLIVLVALTVPGWAQSLAELKSAGANARVSRNNGTLTITVENQRLGRTLEVLVNRGLAMPTTDRGIVIKPGVTQADIDSVLVLGNEIIKNRNTIERINKEVVSHGNDIAEIKAMTKNTTTQVGWWNPVSMLGVLGFFLSLFLLLTTLRNVRSRQGRSNPPIITPPKAFAKPIKKPKKKESIAARVKTGLNKFFATFAKQDKMQVLVVAKEPDPDAIIKKAYRTT